MPWIRARPCDFKDCKSAAQGEDTWCSICRLNLCRAHYDGRRHKCRYQKETRPYQTFEEFLADLDVGRVHRFAQKLRQQEECSIIIPKESYTRDNPNYSDAAVYITIDYPNDARFILRLTVFNHLPPPSHVLRKAAQSECETYRALDTRGTGAITPTPLGTGVGDFSKSQSRHAVWILYRLPPGRPLGPLGDLSSCRTEWLIRSWVKRSYSLEQRHFDRCGSLTMTGRGVPVPKALYNLNDINRIGNEEPFGPFSTMRAMYLSRIDDALVAIITGVAYRQNPLCAYLAHLEVREMVLNCRALGKRGKRFYLRHPGIRAEDILVSDIGSVTGILNWQNAMTVSEEAAFGAPEWAYLSEAFWAGDNALTEAERSMCWQYTKQGRPDRAKHIRNARIHQRLHHFIGNRVLFEQTTEPWKLLLYLQGTHNAFYPNKPYCGPLKINEWVQAMCWKFRDEEHLAIVSDLDFDGKDARWISVWNRWKWRAYRKWAKKKIWLKAIFSSCIADPDDG